MCVVNRIQTFMDFLYVQGPLPPYDRSIPGLE